MQNTRLGVSRRVWNADKRDLLPARVPGYGEVDTLIWAAGKLGLSGELTVFPL